MGESGLVGLDEVNERWSYKTSPLGWNVPNFQIPTTEQCSACTQRGRDSALHTEQSTQNSVPCTYKRDVVRHFQPQRLNNTSADTGRNRILEVGLKTGIPMYIVPFTLRKTNRSQFQTRPYLEINDISPQLKVCRQDICQLASGKLQNVKRWNEPASVSSPM